MFFVDPTSAYEPFEMPTTIFFVISISKTPGNTFNPPCSILPSESELLPLGDSCFCPLGDCCRYLDGTIIAISLNGRLLSSFVATSLGTSHFEGIDDYGLELDFLVSEFSLSANGIRPLPLFPIDTDRLQPDKNCLFSILPPPEFSMGRNNHPGLSNFIIRDRLYYKSAFGWGNLGDQWLGIPNKW
ncbi:hypothetical protein AAC387_Pa08g2292 [Persea americana]